MLGCELTAGWIDLFVMAILFRLDDKLISSCFIVPMSNTVLGERFEIESSIAGLVANRQCFSECTFGTDTIERQ